MFRTQASAHNLALRQLLRRGLAILSKDELRPFSSDEQQTLARISDRLEQAQAGTVSIGSLQLASPRSAFRSQEVVSRYLQSTYGGAFDSTLKATAEMLQDKTKIEEPGALENATRFIRYLLDALEADRNTRPPPRRRPGEAVDKHAGIRRF